MHGWGLALVVVLIAGCAQDVPPATSTPMTGWPSCAFRLADGTTSVCGTNAVDVGVRASVPATMQCMIGHHPPGDPSSLAWYHGPATTEQSTPPVQQGIWYAVEAGAPLDGTLWDLRAGWQSAYQWRGEAGEGFVQPPIDGLGEGLEVAGVLHQAPHVKLTATPQSLTVWWQIAYKGVESRTTPQGASAYEGWELSPILELGSGDARWFFPSVARTSEPFGDSKLANATVGSDHSGNAQAQVPALRDTWRFDVQVPGFTGTVAVDSWVFYQWLGSAGDPFWRTTCSD